MGDSGRDLNQSNVTTQGIIGSRKSAFQPYKSITILTNLQRGNVKTTNREVTAQPLTFHEKAARGELSHDEVDSSNVNSGDESGKTALTWAAFHARLPTVEMLVDKGANVNAVGDRHDSPLMYAAANGHLAVINYLLLKGANVDETDIDGNTPLMFATIGNHAQSVTRLLQSGASLTHTNGNDDNCFSVAVSRRLLAAQHAMENFIREFIESNCIQVKTEHEEIIGPTEVSL